MARNDVSVSLDEVAESIADSVARERQEKYSICLLKTG